MKKILLHKFLESSHPVVFVSNQIEEKSKFLTDESLYILRRQQNFAKSSPYFCSM